jgi:hypothetical protein
MLGGLLMTVLAGPKERNGGTLQRKCARAQKFGVVEFSLSASYGIYFPVKKLLFPSGCSRPPATADCYGHAKHYVFGGWRTHWQQG